MSASPTTTDEWIDYVGHHVAKLAGTEYVGQSDVDRDQSQNDGKTPMDVVRDIVQPERNSGSWLVDAPTGPKRTLTLRTSEVPEDLDVGDVSRVPAHRSVRTQTRDRRLPFSVV